MQVVSAQLFDDCSIVVRRIEKKLPDLGGGEMGGMGGMGEDGLME
jgi:hypothetical protein